MRIALSTSFATSLGDRFGLFGKYGTPEVTWGSWAGFVYFTGKLTFWLPSWLRLQAAYVSTGIEVVLCVLLLVPLWTRPVATVAGILLTIYAVSLAGAYGFLASSSYSVWTAAGAAFLLATFAIKARPSEAAKTE